MTIWRVSQKNISLRWVPKYKSTFGTISSTECIQSAYIRIYTHLHAHTHIHTHIHIISDNYNNFPDKNYHEVVIRPNIL